MVIKIYDKLYKISEGITNKLGEYMNEYYKICNAYMLALLLHYIIYKNFTEKDIIEMIYDMMKNDETLKNYVYDYMKELK